MTQKIEPTRYEFQWAELHSMISSEYWVNAYGPYQFGTPRAVDFLIVSQGGYLNAFASTAMLSEWRALSRKLLRSSFRRELFLSSRKVRREYARLFAEVSKTDVKKLNNTGLLTLLKRYLEILTRIGHNFVISQAEGIFAITEEIKKRLAKHSMTYAMPVLLTPTIPDIISREHIEFSKLSMQKQHSDRQLKHHALRHAWLFFNSYDDTVNFDFLRRRSGKEFNKRRKLDEWKRLAVRQHVIFRGLRDAKLRGFCIFLQKLGIERLELKDCWGGAEYRFLTLFNELSRRIGIPLIGMMRSYTFADYQNFLLTGKALDTDTISRRSQGYVFKKQERTLYFIDERRTVKKFLRAFELAPKPTRKQDRIINEIKGEAAQGGRTRGVCRLVETKDITQVLRDLKRFQKGDILVTHMTQPNMVPIASRAGAIVADEGGIMSHAAVIAREFNIPCVVGTKIATKVLKDGERIEVDGSTGMVRRFAGTEGG